MFKREIKKLFGNKKPSNDDVMIEFYKGHIMKDRAASFRVGGQRRMREGNFFGGERGAHACGFLLNFSKVMENAIIAIRLLIFFLILSDVALGSEA